MLMFNQHTKVKSKLLATTPESILGVKVVGNYYQARPQNCG